MAYNPFDAIVHVNTKLLATANMLVGLAGRMKDCNPMTRMYYGSMEITAAMGFLFAGKHKPDYSDIKDRISRGLSHISASLEAGVNSGELLQPVGHLCILASKFLEIDKEYAGELLSKAEAIYSQIAPHKVDPKRVPTSVFTLYYYFPSLTKAYFLIGDGEHDQAITLIVDVLNDLKNNTYMTDAERFITAIICQVLLAEAYFSRKQNEQGKQECIKGKQLLEREAHKYKRSFGPAIKAYSEYFEARLR